MQGWRRWRGSDRRSRGTGARKWVNVMMEVRRTSDGDPVAFDVVVREGKGETRHQVTASRNTCARLAGGHTAEHLIEAAFRFLLDREPKESILGRFDLTVISRYFPEFERELPKYLSTEDGRQTTD